MGFSGGIWIFWRNTINVQIIKTNAQFVFMQVKEDGQPHCFLTFVYGSPAPQLRRQLSSELNKDSIGFDGPWLVLGDFNVVVSLEEVSTPKNFSFHRSGAFFEQCLVDMGIKTPNFTWCRGTQLTMFKGARLDRALCNVEWQTRYTNATVMYIPRIRSDHTPIMVDTNHGVDK